MLRGGLVLIWELDMNLGPTLLPNTFFVSTQLGSALPHKPQGSYGDSEYMFFVLKRYQATYR